jgi:hypothetical protein
MTHAPALLEALNTFRRKTVDAYMILLFPTDFAEKVTIHFARTPAGLRRQLTLVARMAPIPTAWIRGVADDDNAVIEEVLADVFDMEPLTVEDVA